MLVPRSKLLRTNVCSCLPCPGYRHTLPFTCDWFAAFLFSFIILESVSPKLSFFIQREQPHKNSPSKKIPTFLYPEQTEPERRGVYAELGIRSKVRFSICFTFIFSICRPWYLLSKFLQIVVGKGLEKGSFKSKRRQFPPILQ